MNSGTKIRKVDEDFYTFVAKLEFSMKKVNIISLGCSKNLVDTELLMKQLEKAGYNVEVDVENSKAKIVVINTCGFIGDAKEESINTILEQVELQRRGESRQDICYGMFVPTLRPGFEKGNSGSGCLFWKI